MKSRLIVSTIATVSTLLVGLAAAQACTNLLVTKGASADGSVFITYTCDGEFHPRLRLTPAADYPPDALFEIKDWGGQVRGQIRQAPHTYAVVGLMNEHQLVLSETTFDGRTELQDPDGLLGYYDLMRLALQRAKTAREAIRVMADLATEHGYRDTGESISIGDRDEVWIMELIGLGPGRRGIAWVAVRVPDGMIAVHANKARIGEFPLHDPDNCLYSENVISFAVEQGYFDPKAGQPFRFCDAYCPPTPKNRRYAEARVWSLFRRAAPSLNLSSDYHRGVEGASPYPLWIKPDHKLALADVFALMRDHYEGTEIDMTQCVASGPYVSPNRNRPIHWKVDDAEYAWERPISTQQTGFSFVGQVRAWLPDPVGGVLWYGVDDTYFTCNVPLYTCIDAVPESFATGQLNKFSWDSAWWVFNFVANFANLRYSDMKADIQAVQRDLEGTLLALQPAVETTAVQLALANPELCRRYLTDYSVTHAEQAVKRWRQLGEHLIANYNDGYVQDAQGEAQEAGYPQAWLRRVIADQPAKHRLPERPADTAESKLVY